MPLPGVPPIDAEAVIADLEELEQLTGGRRDGGARRIAWTEEWRRAREWLTAKLGALGLEPEVDEAGNRWTTLPGTDGARSALGVGSHLDSVPEGGWLDGALGVTAALGVVRAWASAGTTPPRALTLIEWADEEGSRFGRSLFGSSAVSGSLAPADVEGFVDAEGDAIAEVLAGNGVELGSIGAAGARLGSIDAYLELHIEQGPVLEADGLPCAAVSGCVGVERFALTFGGRASHAGTTPMDVRRDAGLAAANVALAVERIAADAGGVGTTGALRLDPGIVTAVAGEAELAVDLRHDDATALASMREAVTGVAGRIAEERSCSLAERPIWAIAPIPFDADLVAAAAHCCAEQGGARRPMRSGALHDAAEMARHVPVAMVFSSSIGGVSHNAIEDTERDDLLAAIRAFGELAGIALVRDPAHDEGA